MNDIDIKTYRVVTVLTPETRVLGVPVAVWDNALLGRFQESLLALKGLTYETPADIGLPGQGGKDPA